MRHAVIPCPKHPGKRRPQGLRMRTALITPYGRDQGRDGEPKEALGEGFAVDIFSSAYADG